MSESIPTPNPEEVTREAVIEAYRPFVEKGIANPDALDLNDPEVQRANELFYRWCENIESGTEDDEERGKRANLSKTMFYIDAGFTDPVYLNEVLHQWLMDDAQNAEKIKDNPERTETRKQIMEAIKKIRRILSEQN